ncbi:glycosyl hydrolase [Anaerocolumna cellulosilytica]|uniref:beta-glucosidase n=1 Tax=Anaerocolumna cellulosilytica TaxID=433286 RepID=A0A6S6QVS3_9FIRM|nr:glycoside hydrolase family 3 N-terminal domain-containing protein [Anaerocolumna cellulosilytica]MBB5194090.1 beta-glucosidase [Anaerocolumna cellulosilytica]BCJ94694.1 glycosyl hydrolase [Anaerocolumna cellulosilytica]
MKYDVKIINKKVEDLLSCMSLPEKVGQMIQIPYSLVTREEALAWVDKGAGSFLHVLGDNARELQSAALKTKHGIPLLFGIDAIHGHGLNENATIFPTQLAAACSWNRELIQEMGQVTAREVATDGLHWTFSPVLCLGRDIRWGRINETFGEDPYLAGELGAAIIKGYQGESLDSDESILACAKHYIGYGEAVGGRDSCDTEITYRKMREVFLPPFEKAVKAGCATIMSAYGSIDGTPLTVNEKALRHILREDLGFDGFVVTDWNNVNSLIHIQHVAADIGEASQMAAKAGNDMIMNSPAFYEATIKLVEDGLLDEKVIDEAVGNILRTKFRMGLFEHPEKKGIPGCFGCQEHLNTSEKLSQESIVLLKNTGILPLANTMKRIAVIGPNADDIRAQYGDWTYFSHPEPNPEHPPVRPYVTVLEGIQQLADENELSVEYHEGCSIRESEKEDIAGAVQIANHCDVIVLVIGDIVEQAGEYRDRADLTLTGKQMELFRQLRSLKKPLITVFVASKPLCINTIAEETDALIVGFNGGMFGGLAVAETIFGKLNPSGKLPISFPRHSGQLPVYYNNLPGWHGGRYLDLPDTPLFAFGEGLSYTSFKYSNLKVDETNLTLQVDVSNTGKQDGYEIVQVYFIDCVSSVLTPVKQLIGFEKIYIKANETKNVSFTFSKEDFSLVNSDEKRVTEPGEFILMVGSSSRDIDLLQSTITL